VTQGYVNNPEANIASFTNGWFRTGDEGIIDSEGNLTLVGRLKELINRSGEKVSPCEIDEVLMAHPAVAEAVAFGVPDSVHGEEPSAVVVLREQVSQSDLVAHCRTRLAEFKCPKVIHIVEAIPLTATGKIQRCLVAETVAGESGKPSRVKVPV
ncbi:MAG: AMP-binding protein, partial [Dehalococcoidia bacterium]|nr:AMP-binding protein [Dehalococcoidia bacterium]